MASRALHKGGAISSMDRRPFPARSQSSYTFLPNFGFVGSLMRLPKAFVPAFAPFVPLFPISNIENDARYGCRDQNAQMTEEEGDYLLFRLFFSANLSRVLE